MNQRRYKPTLDREQRLLLPERVEDYVGEEKPADLRLWRQIRGIEAYLEGF